MTRRMIWVLLLGAALIGLAGFTFSLLGSRGVFTPAAVPILVAFTTFLVAGLIILRRLARNRIGWLLVTAAYGFFGYFLAASYAAFTIFEQGAVTPLALAAGWYSAWGWVIFAWPVTFGLPLFFPTGRLASPHWRWLLWLSLVFITGTALLYAFWPGPIAVLAPVTNPLGLSALTNLPITPEEFERWNWPLAILAFSSLVLRFFQARGKERAQIKWFFYVAALFAAWGTYGALADAGLVPHAPPVITPLVYTVFVALFGAAIVIAILKYRLYQIDVIIRRTLIYTTLSVLLALVFFGAVLALQLTLRTLTGRSSQLAIVLSTLAIAALFNPLRLRIQDWIDWRFYRRKYSAQLVLDHFTIVARDETNVEPLIAELIQTVHETVQPELVAVWLKNGNP